MFKNGEEKVSGVLRIHVEGRGCGKVDCDIFDLGLEMRFLFSIQKLYVLISQTIYRGIIRLNKDEFNIDSNINGPCYYDGAQKLFIQRLYLSLAYRYGTLL